MVNQSSNYYNNGSYVEFPQLGANQQQQQSQQRSNFNMNYSNKNFESLNKADLAVSTSTSPPSLKKSNKSSSTECFSNISTTSSSSASTKAKIFQMNTNGRYHHNINNHHYHHHQYNYNHASTKQSAFSNDSSVAAAKKEKNDGVTTGMGTTALSHLAPAASSKHSGNQLQGGKKNHQFNNKLFNKYRGNGNNFAHTQRNNYAGGFNHTNFYNRFDRNKFYNNQQPQQQQLPHQHLQSNFSGNFIQQASSQRQNQNISAANVNALYFGNAPLNQAGQFQQHHGYGNTDSAHFMFDNRFGANGFITHANHRISGNNNNNNGIVGKKLAGSNSNLLVENQSVASSLSSSSSSNKKNYKTIKKI